MLCQVGYPDTTIQWQFQAIYLRGGILIPHEGVCGIQIPPDRTAVSGYHKPAFAISAPYSAGSLAATLAYTLPLSLTFAHPGQDVYS